MLLLPHVPLCLCPVHMLDVQALLYTDHKQMG
jgi:hypothetical protein